MALGGVFMTDTDGNIGTEVSNLTEKVCGLLFDISGQPDFWTKGPGAKLADTFKDNVVQLTSLEEAVKAGIATYTGESDDSGVSQDFLFGIPYYHIKHFFSLAGSQYLYVMFADCKNNWNALIDMQKAANGTISQFGVWTEQSLWKHMDASADKYSVNLVSDLQAVAEEMANEYYAPASILLCANSAKIAMSGNTESTTVAWDYIPTCKINARYVTVLLGQGMDDDVAGMQMALESKTPVGTVGAALGCLARGQVHECMGWVANYDIAGYFPDIEFGFGNIEAADGKLANTTKYSSLTRKQLDKLHDAGYVFLIKYPGLAGHIYFSADPTCSTGDYRTIARNRVINKSRRLVRTVLLPYVNSPIKVDPATGTLSASQITIFLNLVSSVLQAMETAGEISGYTVNIPANQNILKNDTLIIKYSIIPIACAEAIEVTEGLSTTNK